MEGGRKGVSEQASEGVGRFWGGGGEGGGEWVGR